MATNPKTGYKKKTVSGATRVALATRYGCPPGGRCAYCPKLGRIYWFLRRDGKPSMWVHFQLEMDHVIPEFAGGPNTVDNLVLACQRCNRSKGHKVQVA